MGGSKDSLIHNLTPIPFPNGLKYLAENGINQKEECIKRARVFVKQRYSQERLLNDMETTYLNLMEKVPAEKVFRD